MSTETITTDERIAELEDALAQAEAYLAHWRTRHPECENWHEEEVDLKRADPEYVE